MTVADREKIRMNLARVVAAGIARASKPASSESRVERSVAPRPQLQEMPYVDAMEARFAAAEKRLKSRIGYREAA